MRKENQSDRPVVDKELDEIGQQTPELLALLLVGINRLKRREYHSHPFCSASRDDLFELREGGKDIERAIGNAHATQSD
jgi:hypothetical protein